MTISPTTSPALSYVMRIDVDLGTPYDVGPVANGFRRVLPIIGGSFAGERLRGSVIPGGADWNLVGNDEVMRLRAEYLLLTDDGVHIGIHNEGMVRGDPGRMADVTSSDTEMNAFGLYTRMASRYEAPTGPYDWLNKSIFVGCMLPPERLERVSMEIWELV